MPVLPSFIAVPAGRTTRRYALAGMACLPVPASAAQPLGEKIGDLALLPVPLWWCACIVGALALCLIGLWHNRRKHIEAENELITARKELGKRVVERTDKLRAINTRLYTEISRHEATEELLRDTEQYLHSIINSMPSIMIGVTADGVVTHWNSSAERATDVSAAQALGQHVLGVFPDLPVSMEMVRSAMDEGSAQVLEKIRQGEGPQMRYCDITVFPLKTHDTGGAVIQIDDVTMRVSVESTMIQNEKMLALGELAAGMAHEINNPLSVIIQSAQNIQRRTSAQLPKNREVADSLGIELEQLSAYFGEREINRFVDNIRDAGERAANIVKNMLEFSRYSNRQYTAVEIIPLIEHSIQLALPALRLKDQRYPQVQVLRDYPEEDLPLIPCCAAEIQQVLLNLFRNATQAINDHIDSCERTPAITVRLRIEDGQLVLQIEDNGPGMPESVRRHIFEPFFTTKTVGKGTGLGLSVSYFIITEHHGGHIDVSSRRDHGTCFTIKLPLDAAPGSLAV